VLLPRPIRALTTKADVIAIALTIFRSRPRSGLHGTRSSLRHPARLGTPLPAAIFNLLGYYFIAIPLGFVLAFEAGLGIVGIWIGLAFGLAVVATLLVLWIAYRGPARGSVASESARIAVE
jgi:hypothetical protein